MSALCVAFAVDANYLLPSIVLLALLCWPVTRDRISWHSLGDRLGITLLAFLPVMIAAGVHLLGNNTSILAVGLPGGLWSIGWLALLGLWLARGIQRRYATVQTAEKAPLCHWQARPPRRKLLTRLLLTTISTFVAGTVIESVEAGITLQEISGGLLLDAATTGLFWAGGGVIGREIVQLAVDDTSRFTAFETGVLMDHNTFLHQDHIHDYELSDTQLVLETDGWWRSDRKLRRSDIEATDLVCETLNRYTTEPADFDPTILNAEDSAGQSTTGN